MTIHSVRPNDGVCELSYYLSVTVEPTYLTGGTKKSKSLLIGNSF